MVQVSEVIKKYTAATTYRGQRTAWAWMIRPDLTPLGVDVCVSQLALGLDWDAWVSWWSFSDDDIGHQRVRRAMDQGYHLPGALEAAILAGLVQMYTGDGPVIEGQWVPC